MTNYKGKPTGGSAFPLHPELLEGVHPDWRGMTLRDYFAAKAMSGLLAHQSSDEHEDKEIARQAWSIADAMLAERSK